MPKRISGKNLVRYATRSIQCRLEVEGFDAFPASDDLRESPRLISCASISLTLLISVQVNFFTTRGYDPATGQLTSVSDHLGNTTAYLYHPATHKNAGQISEIVSVPKSSPYPCAVDRASLPGCPNHTPIHPVT
jgi:hypothetical protein